MSECLLSPPLRHDMLLFPHEGLQDSAEFALGKRELHRLFLGGYVHDVAVSGVPTPSEVVGWSDVPFVLVILNPAVLVSSNLMEELVAGISADHGCSACVLPSDPRGFTPGVVLDYASRPGFDRFVSRLSAGPRFYPYDGRAPWLYLVTRQALIALGDDQVSWENLPALLGERAVIAGHAYIHSYADYYLNTRVEMLRLLPDTVATLLDVGGGEGNFGKVFMEQRGGQATLLEPNPRMAAAARLKGLEVLEGDFQSVTLHKRYDCVTFLDVLEHLANPLDALIKARQVLTPGGYILLSVPNVGHWSVVWDLLEGSFEYIPVGILCTTHLRFFTRTGLETVLLDAGFAVAQWENVLSPLPESFSHFLSERSSTGIIPNLDSLGTESFHVLARYEES